MIKVNYDLQTTLVKGYYPDDISYNSIPTPYIEITKEEWKANLGKQMCVVDGVFKEYIAPDSVLLANAILLAKSQLYAARELFQYKNVTYNNLIYDASAEAQNKLGNKISSGIFPVQWSDTSYTMQDLSQSEAIALQRIILAQEDSAYRQFGVYLTQINACTTVAQVEALTFNFT